MVDTHPHKQRLFIPRNEGHEYGLGSIDNCKAMERLGLLTPLRLTTDRGQVYYAWREVEALPEKLLARAKEEREHRRRDQSKLKPRKRVGGPAHA